MGKRNIKVSALLLCCVLLVFFLIIIRPVGAGAQTTDESYVPPPPPVGLTDKPSPPPKRTAGAEERTVPRSISSTRDKQRVKVVALPRQGKSKAEPLTIHDNRQSATRSMTPHGVKKTKASRARGAQLSPKTTKPQNGGLLDEKK